MPRHIVTEAFYGNAAWRERLAAPVFKKIKMGKLVQSSVFINNFSGFSSVSEPPDFAGSDKLK